MSFPYLSRPPNTMCSNSRRHTRLVPSILSLFLQPLFHHSLASTSSSTVYFDMGTNLPHPHTPTVTATWPFHLPKLSSLVLTLVDELRKLIQHHHHYRLPPPYTTPPPIQRSLGYYYSAFFLFRPSFPDVYT